MAWHTVSTTDDGAVANRPEGDVRRVKYQDFRATRKRLEGERFERQRSGDQSTPAVQRPVSGLTLQRALLPCSISVGTRLSAANAIDAPLSTVGFRCYRAR